MTVPRVWAVTTGEAGMVAQAEGLARAFGEPFDSRPIRLRAPWSRLPARAAPGLLRHGLGGALAPPWPDLLITCGRCAAAVSVAIRIGRRAGRRGVAVAVEVVADGVELGEVADVDQAVVVVVVVGGALRRRGRGEDQRGAQQQRAEPRREECEIVMSSRGGC